MNAISSKFIIMKILKIKSDHLLLLPRVNLNILMSTAVIKKLKQKVLIISQPMNITDYNNTLPIELPIFLLLLKNKKKLTELTTYKTLLTNLLLNQIKLWKDQINKKSQIKFSNALLLDLKPENAHMILTHCYHQFRLKSKKILKKSKHYLLKSKITLLL